jgi:hypothetical protein
MEPWGAVVAHNMATRLKIEPCDGGFVGQHSQIRITLMRSRIRIRIKVMQIRIAVFIRSIPYEFLTHTKRFITLF